MAMNCTDLEALLADYLDGTLAIAERATLEQHASACPSCREFMRDVSVGMHLLQSAPEVELPPELVTRIAYQAPTARLRHPLDKPGILSRAAARWLQPLLQPKLAMGMAMTVLSFAMLQRCTGIQVQHIQAADLSTVRIWYGVEDEAIRAKDRAVKYYENIRLVYEIESRLKDMEAQPEASSQPPPGAKSAASGGSKGSEQSGKSASQANRPDEGTRRK